MEEDNRRTGSDPLVPDNGAVSGAYLSKRGLQITGAGLLIHPPDVTAGPGEREPVKAAVKAHGLD